MREKGLLSLKACAVRKGDERVSGLSVDETGKYSVHEKCRKEYMRIGVMREVKVEPMKSFVGIWKEIEVERQKRDHEASMRGVWESGD
jgi:hypothetical protein